MKNINAKRNLTKLLCLFLSVCLMLSLASVLGISSRGAHADETEYTEFVQPISIAQSQFEAETTSAPVTPSSWTGNYIGELSGSVTSGIVGLNSTFIDNYDKLDLGGYSEFKKNVIPGTPFGGSSNGSYAGTTKNVLMVNNLGPTAYGYQSDSISLDSNSYYRFSVWVRTGSFAANQGAAITLVGMSDPVGLWNIDTAFDLGGATLDASNNYGFVKHYIYVGTGTNSESVNLSLSVGDYADKDHYYASKGYAFFANVSLDKLSPTTYHREMAGKKASDQLCIFDLNPESKPANILKSAGGADLGSFTTSKAGWTRISDEDANDSLMFGVYNGGSVFVEDGDGYGLTSDPYTPAGKYDAVNKTNNSNNIMVLSSTSGDDNFKSVSGGIRSAGITINKESYYLLSAWYSTQEGATATIAISGESTSYSKEYKLGPIVSSELTSDKNGDRYGWQRVSFIIKGSAFKPVEINVELWLGSTSGTKTSGIAMFDDITLTPLTFKEFGANEFGGTTVSIDSSDVSTSVSNGRFIDMDFEEGDTYPLAPSNWTYITPTTSENLGQSKRAVDEDTVVSGVVPTDNAHYAQNKHNYMGIDNPIPGSNTINYVNTLLLASETPTAFAYRSSSISIAAGSDYKLTAKLMTAINGYGASLILKNDNNIVGNVERIHSNGFGEYSFYIAGAAGTTDLRLEIWFGMSDTKDNGSKLSKGHMFVSEVSLETLTEDVNGNTELTSRLTEYNTTTNIAALNYGIYRLGAFDFNAYDRYSTEAIKPLYDFALTSSDDTQVRAGVIAGTMQAGQNLVPEYFFDAHNKTENRFDNAVILRNISAVSSSYEASSRLTLNADSYYKVDFSLLVELGEESEGADAVGAGLWLDGYGIKDIRGTYNPIPVAGGGSGAIEFQTFSFYYAVGAEASSAAWKLTLGNSEYSNQGMSGVVILNHILLTQIDKSTFDSETEDLDGETHVMAIDKSAVTSEEDEDGDTDTNTDDTNNCSSTEWYVIPSILFAAAIFIAIFGVLFKKLWVNRKPHRRGLWGKKQASYDRKDTLNVTATDSKIDGDASTTVVVSDGAYNEFDDVDATPAPTSAKPATRPAAKPAVSSEPKPADVADAGVADDSNANTETASTKASENQKQKTKSEVLSEFDD